MHWVFLNIDYLSYVRNNVYLVENVHALIAEAKRYDRHVVAALIDVDFIVKRLTTGIA